MVPRLVPLYLDFRRPIKKSEKNLCDGHFRGLRKSRYEGTNQGTKGTVVNQTLLLLPRFPYKNIIIARYLDFRIEKKKKENRGTNCVESKRAHSQPGIYFVKIVKIESMIECGET